MSLVKKVEALNENLSMNAVVSVLRDMAKAIESLYPQEKIEMSTLSMPVSTADVVAVKPVSKKGRPKKNV